MKNSEKKIAPCPIDGGEQIPETENITPTDAENVADGAESHAPEPAAEIGEAATAVAEIDAPATKAGKNKKPRGRIIKSVTRRMILNYFLFATVVLLMMWVLLLFGLNGFYDAIMRDDIHSIGSAAAAAFPKRGDDNGMTVFYRDKLSEIARTNSASFIVFKRDGNELKPVIVVDAIGQSSDTVNENASILRLINSLDYESILKSDIDTGMADTEYGKLVYYCSEHWVDTDEGPTFMYMIAMKSNNALLVNAGKVLLLFVFCTIVVLVLAFVCALFAARYQTKCLTEFTRNAKRVADGDYDVEFTGYGYYEYDTLATALNSAKKRLKSTEQLQRDLIANVSHDMRTPITIIRAYAEMIRDLPQDEKKREKITETIIAEADKLTTFTDDVLNYSRLSSGVTEFNFEDCDISAAAEDILKRFDYFKERDGVKFETEIDSDLIVHCDKNRIEQVMYNFIGNAFNYCGDDKVIIVRVKNMNGTARVEITDHGKGIAPEEQESIWNRYYRAARSKRTTVGSGLGLSICYNILKAHGVEFGVNSELDKGSTFWFEMKIVKPCGGGVLKKLRINN